KSRVEQDDEISGFLRNFMGGNGDCGHNTQLDVGHEGRGNQDAVYKIMECIAEHDHHAASAMIMVARCRRHYLQGGFMHLACLQMTVAPQQEFFQYKKNQNPTEYNDCK